MIKVVILASGSGTNAENIARYFAEDPRVRIVACVVNRPEAGVIDRMKRMLVPCIFMPAIVVRRQPEELVKALKEVQADLVVLAGWDQILPAAVVDAFRGRIINIHPSLLPKYGGKGMLGHHVHEAVIANREAESGVTVHYVTEEPDAGAIIMQESVTVTPDDTAESLEAKIHPVEYSLYPRAIMAVVNELFGAEEEAADDAAEAAATEYEESQEASVDPSMATPPPMPTPDEAWAETLQVEFSEEEAAKREAAAQIPPPMPGMNTGAMPNPFGAPSAPAAPNRAAQQPSEPMPPTNLVWSVLAIVLCCFIPGIVALIYSSQVSSKYYTGDLEGAKKASRRAEIWIIVSFVLGVLSNTLYLPLMLIGG